MTATVAADVAAAIVAAVFAFRLTFYGKFVSFYEGVFMGME